MRGREGLEMLTELELEDGVPPGSGARTHQCPRVRWLEPPSKDVKGLGSVLAVGVCVRV